MTDAPDTRETLRRLAVEAMVDGEAPTRTRRLWFFVDAHEADLLVRGESYAVVADVWGLHPKTVSADISAAIALMKDPANLERARVEVTSRALRRSDEVYQRATTAADREAGALYQASNAALETYGKATGAVASGPLVNVLVDAKGQLRPEVAAAVVASDDAIMAAAERAHVALGGSLEAFRLAVAGELERAPLLLEAGGYVSVQHSDWQCGALCADGLRCTVPLVDGGGSHASLGPCDSTPVDPWAEPCCPCVDCKDVRAGVTEDE